MRRWPPRRSSPIVAPYAFTCRPLGSHCEPISDGIELKKKGQKREFQKVDVVQSELGFMHQNCHRD
jgi:hypothetical protein